MKRPQLRAMHAGSRRHPDTHRWTLSHAVACCGASDCVHWQAHAACEPQRSSQASVALHVAVPLGAAPLHSPTSSHHAAALQSSAAAVAHAETLGFDAQLCSHDALGRNPHERSLRQLRAHASAMIGGTEPASGGEPASIGRGRASGGGRAASTGGDPASIGGCAASSGGGAAASAGGGGGAAASIGGGAASGCDAASAGGRGTAASGGRGGAASTGCGRGSTGRGAASTGGEGRPASTGCLPPSG
jgi:hypothetical protein